MHHDLTAEPHPVFVEGAGHRVHPLPVDREQPGRPRSFPRDDDLGRTDLLDDVLDQGKMNWY